MRRLVLSCFSAVLLILPACESRTEPEGSGGLGSPETRPGPLVAGSVYPLTYLARSALGAGGRVENLTKPGFEPHDAELTPGQIRTISEADLVIYLSGHFQPVVERAVAGLGDRALDVLPAANPAGEPAERPHTKAGSDVHPAGDAAPHLHEDPHVWLDPHRMRQINRHIAGRIAGLHPERAASVLSRAAKTDEELKQLDLEFSSGLGRCRRRVFVTGHGAFGYLAERYGLQQIGIGAGFSESEPSARRLARLVVQTRALGVETVFYERSTSPGSARTLAREIGAKTAVLDSIETAPPSGDYLSAMRRNLLSLRKALGCR